MINWNEVRQEYESTDITLKALAEKHDIKDSTLRSRKNRENWQRNENATQRKNVATHSKRRTEENRHRETKNEPIVESEGITDKQWLFCLYYVKYFNATKAYLKAYECAYSTAMVNGHGLLRNTKIVSEIERMKKEVADGIMLDASAVLQKYIDIAFADITDFVEFGREEATDDLGNPYEMNRVKFKESAEVDGTIITEVKQGKDGVSVKLADKMRALDFLSKYTDLLSENDKKKLQNEKTKMDIAKTKAEIEKMSGDNDDKPIEIVIKRKGDAS
ncbi:terminase small subunit [Bacillus badius]|uniref:Phage terminase small subunit n=1 Tax=Bacillus badius TaxID=1455 RepID=A0ABR5AXW0_BACBA|nr:terminase small subunit [Bacillus badius]KIL79577.1 Phage terminase small subunit [Bacillus badius]MED4716273.1 terminase small subunit [Bacillus badius]